MPFNRTKRADGTTDRRFVYPTPALLVSSFYNHDLSAAMLLSGTFSTPQYLEDLVSPRITDVRKEEYRQILHPRLLPAIISTSEKLRTMRPHPHKQWTQKYPSLQPAKRIPKIVAKKFYLETNRLYARTSNLFIRKHHLPTQSHLNDRQTRLQDYLRAERETRGNGSPLHSNPQQVFTFSATDEVPINTVLGDDFIEFVDDPLVSVDEHEHELECVMIPEIALSMEGAYLRMVDRSHRRMVRSLVGPAFDVDLATVMRTERSLSALGF